MKRKIIYNTLYAAILLTMFTACGDDSSTGAGSCNGFLWTQEIEAEITAVSQAGSAYGTNPTVQSCEAYKGSLRTYVDALEDLNVSCIAEANEQEYQQAIVEARASIDDIDCSDVEPE